MIVGQCKDQAQGTTHPVSINCSYVMSLQYVCLSFDTSVYIVHRNTDFLGSNSYFFKTLVKSSSA